MRFSNLARTEGDRYAFRLHTETFRALLDKNVSSLQILADLEADLNHLHYSDFRIRRPLLRLFDETLLMAQELNLLSGDRFTELYGVMETIRESTLKLLSDKRVGEPGPLVVKLSGDEALDPSLAGGKAVSVAGLSRHFPDLVPDGFLSTTAAYRLFLKENDLEDRIRLLLHDMDVLADRDLFRSRIDTIRGWILSAGLPEALREGIREHAERIAPGPEARWAVRSSAVNEGGRYSFAGQFHSELFVAPENLEQSFLKVLSGRFAEKALLYRMHVGLREVDTPMAVLFMPMIDPAAAGVIHTTDPQDPDRERMVVHSVAGLGDRVVQGQARVDTLYLSRDPNPSPEGGIPAEGEASGSFRPDYMGEADLQALGRTALAAAGNFGHDLEIEWAMDRDHRLFLLQARRMEKIRPDEAKARITSRSEPVAQGGVTVFPGRAVGEVVRWREGGNPKSVPKGAILVVEEPGPEISTVLPRLAAIIAEKGNPVGHVATLVREFSVPGIFRMGPAADRLKTAQTMSVNATSRKVYDGARWPGIRERVLARISSASQSPNSGPLHGLVMALNLTDPDDASFKAGSCKSIHDTLRFMHEMGVRSLFRFGDEQSRGFGKKFHKLKTSLPLKVRLIGLDNCLAEDKKNVEPKDINSLPFQALWRGISDENLPWPERWKKEMMGLPKEFREAVLGANTGPRRPGDPNYAIIARDYLNLNARLDYHYAIVDAMVGPDSGGNHVHFSFRGGGGNVENRKRRVRFLEFVLRDAGFGVDRKGDMLAAWLRRHPLSDSKKALEMLGRLLVCSRQLDAALKNDTAVKLYATHFLEGNYAIFS